ncbi:MAG: hypothetical protein K0U29_02365 [Gammaproteobacteria bacterium]|nr:hypothetical protein [Gammaproteobacteria bacterium]
MIVKNVDGTGHAKVVYKVRDPKGKVTVYARGIRKAGKWKVTQIEIKTPGNQVQKLGNNR